MTIFHHLFFLCCILVGDVDNIFPFSYREGQIYLPFPKESPLSSHMSRQAMSPSPTPAEPKYQGKITSPTPPPIIVNKAMGSFARREVVTPVFNSRTSPPLQHPVRPVAVSTNS